MDLGQTISRALNYTWQHKRLWGIALLPVIAFAVLFILLFLGLAGSLGAAALSGGQPRGLGNSLGAGALVLSCLSLLGYLAVIVLALVAQGGLIEGVRQITDEGRVASGAAMRVGWSKAGSLFLASLLIFLPMLLIACLAAFGVGAAGGFAAAAGGRSSQNAAGALVSSGICVFIGLYCVFIVYALVAAGILTLAYRAIVLNNVGPVEGLQAGWRMFRTNLGNVILLWIVLIVIAMIVGAVLSIFNQLAFAPLIASMAALGPGADPGEVFAQMAAQMGAVVGPALIIGTVLTLIWSLLYSVFSSAIWTLAYQQFTGKAPTTSGPGTPNSPSAPLPTM